MKAKSGTVKAAVLTYCEIKDGLTLRELADKIERTVKVTHSTIKPLLEHGELHRAGIKPWCRYFTDLEHAQEFEKIAPALVAKHREQQYQKTLAQNRDYAHRMAEQAGKWPAKPHAKKAKPEKKPNRASVELRPSGLHIATTQQDLDAKKKHLQARITQPDHVKVQHIPHGVDTRFTFTPPPGWKGEITRDWMDRRLAEAEMTT